MDIRKSFVGIAGILCVVAAFSTTHALGGNPPKPLQSPFTPADAEKARADWAKYLDISARKEIDLGRKAKIELLLIPPGKFRIGSWPAERKHILEHFRIEIKGEDERDVTITRPFYLAVTETTQEQYEAMLGWARNISWFNSTGGGKNNVAKTDTGKLPAERVTWNDANDFCEELNERLKGKIKARLPTEAEWEYACRAGSTTAFHFGGKLNGRQANCNGSMPFGDDEKGPYLEATSNVASYTANAFGLFDMHGNIWEWCLDFYGEETQNLGPINPLRSTKVNKSLRVLRGGAWDTSALRCRAAERGFAAPERRDNAFGFRICMPIE